MDKEKKDSFTTFIVYMCISEVHTKTKTWQRMEEAHAAVVSVMKGRLLL